MASEQDNPFFSMVGMMRQQGGINNPTPYLIGRVVSPQPLQVQIGENIIERSSIKVNTFLLAGYQRRHSLATTAATGITGNRSGGGGDASFSSHNHDMQTVGIPDGTYTTLDDFSAGDEVLLLQSVDQQQYILVCKLG